MRSQIMTILLELIAYKVASAIPTYSCFDPPAVESQTNPHGEGLEDLVEAECCEALIDEGDFLAERLVVWDPVNCNHGPNETAITEAFLCRAHDTDGCRFCHLSCEGFEGLCITCYDIYTATTEPTPSLVSPGPTTSGTTKVPIETPVPFNTPAPLLTFPETSSPSPTPTLAPAVGGDSASDCDCIDSMPDVEAEVLVTLGKTMRCDPTCSNGEDLVWGVLNCNYFGLGQDCRTCSDTCEEQPNGVWLDQYHWFCKPCYAIP